MKVKAVIFDWAGTTVDFGSCGPVRAMWEAFDEFGIALTETDLRQPMGLLKRDHIAAILQLPHVTEAWKAKHGAIATASDIDRIYARFIPLQEKTLRNHSVLIPDVLPVLEALRRRGIRIGSTTGYTRAMLEPIAKEAEKQGYRPDASVTPDEVGAGRPAPFMLLENLVRLQTWPPSAVVKVGDTPADIEEGLNAGVWTIGVAGAGNGVGAGAEAFQKLEVSEQTRRVDEARRELLKAGAHFVIATLKELESVISQIEEIENIPPYLASPLSINP
jgi:phosphonoacetaldehyde hydrolase